MEKSNVAMTVSECKSEISDTREHHNVHHMGVEKTIYLLERFGIAADVDEVKRMIKECNKCNSIDPSLKRVTHDSLSIQSNWERLALDHTHYNGITYLSMIDCGPSRFSVWKRVNSESAQDVIAQCQIVFSERGPPREIWVDNGTAFRSSEFKMLCNSWGVNIIYRCAYRPSTNGIVERCHRTIKRIAKRSDIPIWKAVFYYNVVPRGKGEDKVVPAESIYRYNIRLPVMRDVAEKTVKNGWKIGDKVFVKPHQHTRCTETWTPGVVTKVVSDKCVDVDGVTRHIQDIRQRQEENIGLPGMAVDAKK